MATVITKKMKEALDLARKQEDHINIYQLHHKTLRALLDRGLLEATQGYGWQHGAVFRLTTKTD